MELNFYWRIDYAKSNDYLHSFFLALTKYVRQVMLTEFLYFCNDFNRKVCISHIAEPKPYEINSQLIVSFDFNVQDSSYVSWSYLI